MYPKDPWGEDSNDALASNNDALNEYASNAGSEHTESAWILTPWDVWQPNPSYKGPPVPHPEFDDPHSYPSDGNVDEEYIKTSTSIKRHRG